MNLIEALANVMVLKGVPEHMRSDNGTELTSKVLDHGLPERRALGLHPPQAGPWKVATSRGCAMSCLNVEVFFNLADAHRMNQAGTNL